METTETMTAQAQMSEQNAGVEALEKIDEIIEAILFAAGHPVTYTQLAKVFDISPSLARQHVEDYADRYNASPLPRGVILVTFEDSCQLCTKQQYLTYIREALGIRRNGTLSNSSIETLAVIAYNQPVTRAYVDTVRGVDSSYALSSLLERKLIEAKGRVDAPGRPMLYGTTEDFLRCFGIRSLSELPGIDSGDAVEILTRLERQTNEALHGVDKDQLTMDDSLLALDREKEGLPDSTEVAESEESFESTAEGSQE